MTSLYELLEARCDAAQLRTARSLIGRAVTLLVGSNRRIQGTVTGVLLEAGTAKIIVAGRGYRLEQLVDAAPLAVA